MSMPYPPWERFPLVHRPQFLRLLGEISLKHLPAGQAASPDSPSQDSRDPSRPPRLRVRAPVHASAGPLRHRE
jgi:hypothetical protein